MGVKVIVFYKATKALLELALVGGLVALGRGGGQGALLVLAEGARAHLAGQWSTAASHALEAVTNQHVLHLLESGLALDAILTSVEGWGLWKGYRWGAWLVVCATLVPLPIEVGAIVRHGSWTRVAIAAVNLSIAAYLASRIIKASRGPPPTSPAAPSLRTAR